MFCSQCGKSIPDESGFCPYCGNPQAAPTPAQASSNPVRQVDPPAYVQPQVPYAPTDTAPNYAQAQASYAQPNAAPNYAQAQASYAQPNAAPNYAQLGSFQRPSVRARKRQQARKKRFWIQAVAGFLAVAILVGVFSLIGVLRFGSGSKLGSTRLEGAGFSSGDKALLAFVDAMQRCDVDEMISCFAIESWNDHFRFQDYFSEQDYRPEQEQTDYLPEDSAFGRDVNYRIRLYTVCNDAAHPFEAAACGCFAQGLIPSNNWNVYFRMLYQEGDRGTSYDSYLSALCDGAVEQTFRALQVVGQPFDITTARLENLVANGQEKVANRVQEVTARMAASYGADDLRDYGVAVVVGGLPCYFTVETVCYEGRWYINKVGSGYADHTTYAGGFCLSVPGGN